MAHDYTKLENPLSCYCFLLCRFRIACERFYDGNKLIMNTDVIDLYVE